MEYTDFKSAQINKRGSTLVYGTRNFDKLLKTDLSKAKSILDNVLDLGINFIMTAQHYDGGLTESFIGEMYSGIRDEIIIGTSGGIIHSPDGVKVDLSPKTLEEQISNMLKRLQTDYLDLFQLHHDDYFCNIKETADYLNELLNSGTIKSLGVTNFRNSRLQAWLEFVPIHTIQLPYNLLQQNGVHYFQQVCGDFNIDIIVHSIMGGGMLTVPDIMKTDLFPYLKDSVQDGINILREEFDILLQQMDLTVSEFIFHWLQTNKDISFILFGTQDLEHLNANVSAYHSELTTSELREIEKFAKTSRDLLNQGLLIPFKIEDTFSVDDIKYSRFFGMPFALPNSVSVGDTIYMDDGTGEIITQN